MKIRPWHGALLVLAIIVGMTALATRGTAPGAVKSQGDVITSTVGAVEPDATATFSIVLQEGGDAEHESSHVFETLKHPSIATLSFDTKTLKLTVAYDSAGIGEDSIRQQLVQSGYVEQTAADAVPAQLAADGATQTLHLVPGDFLAPSLVRAEAGVPLVITFSAGTDHLATVSIPSLGITQDITTEGASITIENPRPGEYELVCAAGYTDGVLFVE